MESIVHSTDTLAVIASVAIAIAGFSGVVVALTGRTADSFGPLEKLNFRILLQVSALALFFAIVPLILHRGLEPSAAWRVSMLLYGTVHLADAGFFFFRARHSTTISRVQRLTPRLGIGIAVFQLLFVAFGTTTVIEVAYLLVLIWHLAIAGMGFTNLLFASREAEGG